ncbi:PDDEXK family nuclease [Xylella fastidiosa]|uniref:VRR-NUC domain-containing protein n=1 Tax=Xylella fastidiosa subsp. fastidiosa TaxID=644356 RepID=A0AAJ5R168_XYLFS|nr:VRR-NUC domain-containing protein [Xylella fastidiosa]TNW21585.1 VRR-NUC domain-containing protein [Xylella fastidiosa subsp. pauca]TNW23045.1 VRR-NUC domain-containing protein [Xylella fastidiosa subsp. pauca]TNW23450.1 VRR-NUC domain-containing protein [Xylella fastidiosa subsp. pauca]WCF28679.1 VRR-NUC domain-containing protein [Xylella fastidiosa subsp. fastidiosa]
MMTIPRERTIERYLVAQVRAKGGEIRKVKWGGRHGAPDRIAMLPEGRTLWVELKAPGQPCTPHQVREHERMRGMGQRVVVVDSLKGVDEVLA